MTPPAERTPPFPLPDYPRAAPSELGALAARVLEYRDVEALTRLPDMLQDAGRSADAKIVKKAVAIALVRLVVTPHYSQWEHMRGLILAALFRDVFDWAGVLAVLGRGWDDFDRMSGFDGMPF